MPLPTYYAAGTASVANGDTTVTFSGAMLGTEVMPNIMAGDLFLDPAQPEIPPQRIASIDYGAGTAELSADWPGTTMSDDPYEVRYIGIIERSTAQNRRYLEMLGQLQALGIQPNAFGEFADREVYDDERKGFIFLSLSSPWTLYAKLSGDSADWDAGQPMEGAEGPQGERGWSPIHGIVADGARRVQVLLGYVGGEGEAPTDHVGEYVAADGYTETIGEAVDIRGSAGADGIDGIDGESFNWAGEYDNGTAYDEDDVVQHNGSSWIALQATTGNVPPTLPTTANDYWELVAAKGADGAGSGDVTAAANIADGALVVGDGGGKGIKEHPGGAPGSAAFADTGDFATAAQGGLAETAVQPIDLGTAAAADTGDFAAAAAGVPSGGTTGQVLAKKSSTDHDTEWVEQSGGREVLTGNLTYYVRTDGSDSNDGLADTSGGAFATIQKAIDVASGLDLSICSVTISVADGTYNENPNTKPFVGGTGITIQGNTSSPSSCVLNGGAGVPLTCQSGLSSLWRIRGFRLETTSVCLNIATGLLEWGEIDFAGTGSSHVQAFGASIISAIADYKISGAAQRHIRLSELTACRVQGRTITLTGTPNFSAGFVSTATASTATIAGNTFVGSATGPRYSGSTNSVIQTNAATLPGSTDGSLSSGAQYA